MLSNFFSEALQSFLSNESGQDLIEYALIAAVIGLGTIVALKNVALGVGNVFAAVDTNLQNSV
jgi:pilus assembly protein Flp/PilA